MSVYICIKLVNIIDIHLEKKNTHAHTYTHAYLSVPSFAYPVTNPQRTQGI